LTGDFYFGDVGMATREEINVEPSASPGGRNYGWPCMEGILCTTSLQCECNGATLTNPLHDYGRGEGICVIGGYVYRGSAIPAFQGLYFFADYLGAKVWSFRPQPVGAFSDLVNRSVEFTPLDSTQPIRFVVSMGEDAAGELYMCVINGKIYKIVPRGCTPDIDVNPVPQSLAAGRTISLSVLAGGADPRSFQWRHAGDPLVNDARITGANSPTLSITNAQEIDSGAYDVIITGPCGSVTSAAATVEIFTCPSADINDDGTVSVQDLFDFLEAFFSADLRADINQSGTLTVQDIFDYLASYFRFCT
jgi:hypothetical protein